MTRCKNARTLVLVVTYIYVKHDVHKEKKLFLQRSNGPPPFPRPSMRSIIPMLHKNGYDREMPSSPSPSPSTPSPSPSFLNLSMSLLFKEKTDFERRITSLDPLTVRIYFSLDDWQKRFLAHHIAARAAARNPIPATMPIEIALFLRYAGTSRLTRSLVATSSEIDIAATSNV